ncbi:MAG: hypothetical protein WDO15_06230 [Bacteroidota bacterium]
MIITSLPWLRQERIDFEVRTALLKVLEKKSKVAEQFAREAMIDLLTLAKPAPDSRAFQERDINLSEQRYFSKKYPSIKAVKELLSYQEAGLISDRGLNKVVKRRLSFWTVITIFISITLITPTTGFLPSKQVEGHSGYSDYGFISQKGWC